LYSLRAIAAAPAHGALRIRRQQGGQGIANSACPAVTTCMSALGHSVVGAAESADSTASSEEGVEVKQLKVGDAAAVAHIVLARTYPQSGATPCACTSRGNHFLHGCIVVVRVQVIVLGDGAVGKTSILQRFGSDTFGKAWTRSAHHCSGRRAMYNAIERRTC
ncbi:hypothetical protein EON66_02605, partial [archaeon]